MPVRIPVRMQVLLSGCPSGCRTYRQDARQDARQDTGPAIRIPVRMASPSVLALGPTVKGSVHYSTLYCM